jgi:hypothetical protein
MYCEPPVLRVYLDDCRTAPEGWFRVVRGEEILTLLRLGLIKEMSLDHDLGDFAFQHTEVDTGKQHDGTWLCRQILEDVMNGKYAVLPRWSIHSANPAGAERMVALLNKAEELIHLA